VLVVSYLRVFLHHYRERDAHSRMTQVKQEVRSVDVVNVAVVAISPVARPRISNDEPISAELESRLTFHDYRLANDDRMLPAELRTEFVVRNPASRGTGCVLVRPSLLLRMILLPGIFGLPVVFRSRRFSLLPPSAVLLHPASEVVLHPPSVPLSVRPAAYHPARS
jgi:hypothetical protein